MNRWEEQFANHPIHKTLGQLREYVSKEFDDIDEGEVSERRRFLKLISKYEEIFKSLDPEIIPFNQLDSLNNTLIHPNINNQITAYAQNGNVSHLVAASNILTDQLASLCLLTSISNKDSYKKPIEDLEKLIDYATETLVEKKNTLSDKFEKLDVSANENIQKISELSVQIEQKKSELNALQAEWQSQFSNAQELRSQEFSKWRDNFSTEKNSLVDNVIEEYEDKLNASIEDFTHKVDEILDDGNDKHQAILELYEITAGDSVGAGYLKNANTEKKQADNWRLISVSFIFLTVCWLLFAYFYNISHFFQVVAEQPVINNKERRIESDNQSNDTAKRENANILKAIDYPLKTIPFPWYALFSTFSLSGVLLWGSAYAAQQSTKHRNNEKRTRWFALEVKAIDPFINSLEPSEKNELKKQLCDRIFGQSVNGKNDDTKVIDEHVLKTVADTLGSILSKIPK